MLRRFVLSIVSALLFSFAWPPAGFVPLIFVAWIPLLYLEHTLVNEKRASLIIFGFSYLTFLLWNILTTWWIYNASLGGAIMAIVANAFLMAMVFQLFRFVKKRFSTKKFASFILIPIWISFEFLHLDWDLTWPWLTLGNVFSGQHTWIQWYEYTGVFGGSAWVLIVNCFGFYVMINWEELKATRKKMAASIFLIISLILLPITISYAIYMTYKSKSDKIVNVVIVQPNIDPYHEKFSQPYETQLEKMLGQAKNLVDSTTDFLVFPETAITEDFCENNLSQVQSLERLRRFAKEFTKLTVIAGASTYKIFEKGEKLSATARKFRDEEAHYDSYNTAICIDSSARIQIYHKSKLVPGVEKMPFPWLFKPIEKLAIDLGGATGSLGIQEERSVFYSSDSIAVAPVICYESIYGGFVSDYIKNGAQAIFIITNDGWWGDTPGYKQHLLYGRLRAIETRRQIARSANTGISCTINEIGEISNRTQWWTPAAFKSAIDLNNHETFYVRFGDYIAHACLVLSGLFILLRIIFFKRAWL